jgi:hypothetical protein
MFAESDGDDKDNKWNNTQEWRLIYAQYDYPW